MSRSSQRDAGPSHLPDIGRSTRPGRRSRRASQRPRHISWSSRNGVAQSSFADLFLLAQEGYCKMMGGEILDVFCWDLRGRMSRSSQRDVGPSHPPDIGTRTPVLVEGAVMHLSDCISWSSWIGVARSSFGDLFLLARGGYCKVMGGEMLDVFC
uniref:Uncharacterized protein n=1 Tax=Corethron hystrix TaxID=216773 RepID=A0A7S1B6B4_9STRA